MAQDRREYYQKNKETILARVSKWQKDNKERSYKNKKCWLDKNREKRILISRRSDKKQWDNGIRKNRNLMRRYKITTIEFDRMYQIQSGCCAICKSHSTEFEKGLHIDHSHKTGKVRGLLCGPCNMRLGTIENIEWREKAEKYLSAY